MIDSVIFSEVSTKFRVCRSVKMMRSIVIVCIFLFGHFNNDRRHSVSCLAYIVCPSPLGVTCYMHCLVFGIFIECTLSTNH